MSAAASTVVVFTGGDPVAPGAIADLGADAFVIAADSGVEHALAHGRRVDLAVGDFDSVAPAALAAAEAAGAVLDAHPAAKDKTDFELALDAAVDRGPARIVVVGGHGGRLDHFVGNAAVLLSDAYARGGARIEARMGDARLFVVRDELELRGAPGELVSLLAVTRVVTGITTTGLRYALEAESLHPGSSRGVSNELLGHRARVTVGEGPLLVVQPGATATSA